VTELTSPRLTCGARSAPKIDTNCPRLTKTIRSSDRIVMLVAYNSFIVARHFDAFAARRGVGHSQKLIGGNLRVVVETQQTAIRHGHVYRHDEVALRYDD